MAVVLRPFLLGEANRVFPPTVPGSSLGDLESFPAQGPQMVIARSSFLGPPAASRFLSGLSCLFYPPLLDGTPGCLSLPG